MHVYRIEIDTGTHSYTLGVWHSKEDAIPVAEAQHKRGDVYVTIYEHRVGEADDGGKDVWTVEPLFLQTSKS